MANTGSFADSVEEESPSPSPAAVLSSSVPPALCSVAPMSLVGPVCREQQTEVLAGAMADPWNTQGPSRLVLGVALVFGHGDGGRGVIPRHWSPKAQSQPSSTAPAGVSQSQL